MTACHIGWQKYYYHHSKEAHGHPSCHYDVLIMLSWWRDITALWWLWKITSYSPSLYWYGLPFAWFTFLSPLYEVGRTPMPNTGGKAINQSIKSINQVYPGYGVVCHHLCMKICHDHGEPKQIHTNKVALFFEMSRCWYVYQYLTICQYFMVYQY